MTSVCTKDFKECYEALPARIQKLADKSFGLWCENTKHPSLNFERIDDEEEIWSARIGDHYRALCKKRKRDGKPRYVWFWIGTHEEYNKL